MADPVLVPAAETMDDETFVRHMYKRHADDFRPALRAFDPERYHPDQAWIRPWRAFHERMHALTITGYDHEHAIPQSRSQA